MPDFVDVLFAGLPFGFAQGEKARASTAKKPHRDYFFAYFTQGLGM